MPKFGQSMSESVFYLFGRDPKSGEIKGPYGTGFFVCRDPDHPRTPLHVYAVSNWHVVCGDAGASIIRVNTRDRKSRLIELDPGEWTVPKDGDDLIAVDITDHVDSASDDIIGLEEDVFITPEVVKEFQIGTGEDIFMSGLFASHHGGNRNVPVIRFGNIAMMASEAAPVELETGGELPCYLVDTRSRSGFSGSPVFAFRLLGSDLTHLPYGFAKDAPGAGLIIGDEREYFWGLLGIHCGQYWDRVQVRTKRPWGRAESAGKNIQEGDELLIHSGMTIVIPAWRISQLLDQGDFEMKRKQREKDWEPKG